MSLDKQLSQTIGYCLKQFLSYNMVTCTPKNYFLHIVDICLMPNGLLTEMVYFVWKYLYIFVYLSSGWLLILQVALAFKTFLIGSCFALKI